MQNLDKDTITEAVLERHKGADNERLKHIVSSLVRHLHEFAREVELTEAEWEVGIQFLTEVGQTCSDTRQECILLSDTLGLSTLVVAQNNDYPAECTEATVFGPFHVENAPRYALGDDISNGQQGTPWFIQGRVLDNDGQPVPNARMEVWQADECGYYDVQLADNPGTMGRGVLHADDQGNYHFRSIVPACYPIPHDGPVGRMLEALNRHPWRPAHLHFMITAPGCERLVTHVFRSDGDYLDSDAVFGVRSSLIADWEAHEAGTRAPNDEVPDEAYYTLNFDFVLNRTNR